MFFTRANKKDIKSSKLANIYALALCFLMFNTGFCLANEGVDQSQITNPDIRLTQEKTDDDIGSDGQSEPKTDPKTDVENLDNTDDVESEDLSAKNISEDITSPEIQHDLSKLPFPTRKMRELIYNAALTGDIENLRPFIGHGDDVTMLSLGGFDEDPISFLKSISGDDDGRELLAIIIEILDAGYVKMDVGGEKDMYVWPYFFAHSLQTLTPEQKVQLYKLITHGDYQDMEAFGAYIFYRLGISPEGRWRFLVAGD